MKGAVQWWCIGASSAFWQLVQWVQSVLQMAIPQCRIMWVFYIPQHFMSKLICLMLSLWLGSLVLLELFACSKCEPVNPWYLIIVVFQQLFWPSLRWGSKMGIFFFQSEVQFLTDFSGDKTSLRCDNPAFHSCHALKKGANKLFSWAMFETSTVKWAEFKTKTWHVFPPLGSHLWSILKIISCLKREIG